MNEILTRILASRPARALARPRLHRPLALGLLVLIALGSWYSGGARRPVTLLFPRAGDARIVGELRALRSAAPEAGAEDLLSELLLGPASPTLLPLFAPGTRVAAVLLRDGVLYADLDEGALGPGGAPLRVALAAAERSLRLGAPGLRRVELTVGGVVPFDSEPRAASQKK